MPYIHSIGTALMAIWIDSHSNGYHCDAADCIGLRARARVEFVHVPFIAGCSLVNGAVVTISKVRVHGRCIVYLEYLWLVASKVEI